MYFKLSIRMKKTSDLSDAECTTLSVPCRLIEYFTYNHLYGLHSDQKNRYIFLVWTPYYQMIII